MKHENSMHAYTTMWPLHDAGLPPCRWPWPWMRTWHTVRQAHMRSNYAVAVASALALAPPALPGPEENFELLATCVAKMTRTDSHHALCVNKKHTLN